METLSNREADSPILSWFVIKARSIPEGEAPEEIKKQWQDVALPIREKASQPSYGVGVLTGEEVIIEEAIPVRTGDAILALRSAGKEEAAAWWEANGYTHGEPTLFFNADEGRLVRGNTLEDAQVAPFYGGVSPYV